MDSAQGHSETGEMSTPAATRGGSRTMEAGTARVPGETRAEMMHPASRTGMMATSIATGVAVSAITATGRGIMSTFAKHPIVMFSLGLVTGYLVHKYRKEIISTVGNAAGQSKDFVLRQKENLTDMLAETKEAAEESGGSS